MVNRRRRAWILATVAGVGLFGALAVPWVIDEVDSRFDRPGACNHGSGNESVEAALIDHLPQGTLRGYLNIGSDCDERTSGSVAAAWAAGARPADVVDLLVREGWSRTDPTAGPPGWYLDRVEGGDSIATCLTEGAEAWQGGRAEYPHRICNLPTATQIVLATTKDAVLFVARINLFGMTVDAASENDEESVRLVRTGQLPSSP